MEITTHPLFALYVMWHPSYPGGRQIADEIRMHFSRNLYRAVEAERGVSVLERCEPVPDSLIPLPIDWDNAEFTTVVVLADSTLVDDRDWVDHVRSIAQTAKRRGIPTVFSRNNGSSGARVRSRSASTALGQLGRTRRRASHPTDVGSDPRVLSDASTSPRPPLDHGVGGDGAGLLWATAGS